jgi:hypothetical protein
MSISNTPLNKDYINAKYEEYDKLKSPVLKSGDF